jgi:hypothetical protein
MRIGLALVFVLLVSSFLGGCGGGGGSSSSGTAYGVAISSVNPESLTVGQLPATVTLNGIFNEPGSTAWMVQFLQNGSVVSANVIDWSSQWVSATKMTVTISSSPVPPAGTYDIQVEEGGPTGNHDSAITSADRITFN